MKILIISDSHGNLKNLEHAIGFARAVRLAAIIHCGDWDTPQAVEVVKRSGLVVYGVLGNADIDPLVTSNLEGTNIHFDKDFLEFETGKRKIGVCHFPGKLEDATNSGKYDVLFHGHTHRKKDEVYGKIRVVNPGALSKTDSPSFAVYDTDKNSVEFITIAI
ncbi:MAG: YfcE family phosphodiesterase [bacterium]|nr:YfcE family phosphodiesterase [bacterium]